MLLTKEVECSWSNSNKKYYIEKGYTYTKNKDTFIVKIEDLTLGSHVKVKILCDYCKLNIIEKQYKTYIRDTINGTIHKDACSNCVGQKRKEGTYLLYGVEHIIQLPEVMEKIKNTSLEKYGVEYCLQNNEIREQIKRTNVEKYGTEFPTQNEEVKEKVKNTNLQKYGYTNVFQNEDVKLKSKNTKIKKYGVSSLMKRKDFLQNMLIKSKITKFKNSTQICSKQQKYIHSLIGGELNFPVGILSLDIAFPDENIYVEYDGSGHDLHVKMNKMTIEEFNFQELKRYKFLKSQGWKQIKIISRNDYLPSNEILLNLIKQTKEYLQNNHNWVEIDLDNKAIRIKNLIIEYDFGELKRIS